MRVEKKEAHRVEAWHQCTDSAVEVDIKHKLLVTKILNVYFKK